MLTSRRDKSVDLTRLPSAVAAGTASDSKSSAAGDAAGYSSREVKPAGLLAQELLRAHSVFLLHHGGSLGASLQGRDGRARLTRRLRRYWDLFLSSWNVMLHANPVRDAFGGIKIAACGELGVGVGEEERGSGEREVLEGFVDRVDGLVDLIVSKFGEGEPDNDNGKRKAEPWIGTGNGLGGEDGAIFLGVGALSRQSLRDVTYWMEDLYVWGENAYGVVGRSSITGQAKRKKDARKPSPPPVSPSTAPSPAPAHKPHSTGQTQPAPSGGVPEFGPPPPLIGPGRAAASRPTAPRSDAPKGNDAESERGGGVDKLVSYLKMGYGTYWTLGGSASGDSAADDDAVSQSTISQRRSKDESEGHYLVGLMGDVDEDGSGTDTEDGHLPRTHLRTLTVELTKKEEGTTGSGGPGERESGPIDGDGADKVTNDPNGNRKKLQVVVYVNAPFIFTFLFEPGTQSLSSDELYRSLHYQLAPLRKPLVSSTAYRPGKPDVGGAATQIYDLVWDPETLTVHSTIPNIPDPGPGQQTSPEAQIWSRVDALNTHTQILNIFAATRADPSELERTAKTSRGWWIVWSRVVERESPVPGRPSSSSDEASERQASDAEVDSFDDGSAEGRRREQVRGIAVTTKEIFLVRKAGDHGSSGVRGVSSSYVSGGGGWTDGASRLAQGIGVDTRKYIEGLLSLNR